MRLRRIAILPLVFLLAGSLVACGGSESEDGSETADADTTEQASADVDRTVTIEPKGNQMKYATEEFTVAPGETVRLVLNNTATSPSMQHNIVIADSSSADLLERIGKAGTKAGSTNDYIPQGDELQNRIIANTPISEPGETVEVTFTVPEEVGEYGYVCTYPGHWATMQGTMIVEEDAA